MGSVNVTKVNVVDAPSTLDVYICASYIYACIHGRLHGRGSADEESTGFWHNVAQTATGMRIRSRRGGRLHEISGAIDQKYRRKLVRFYLNWCHECTEQHNTLVKS